MHNKILRIGVWSLGGTLTLLLILCLIINVSIDHRQYEGVDTPTSGKTITYLLIDGLTKSAFERLLGEGKLPNIQKMMNSGIYVQNGIASFPTMTGYGFYPFLTGVDATKSGVLGLRWFDRSKTEGNLRNYVGRTNVQMNNDIRSDYSNLFEHFSENYTSSINTYMNKGVKHNQKTGWEMTSAKYEDATLFQVLQKIPYFGDRITFDYFKHENRVTELAIEQLKRNPKVQWVTYATPDASHHIVGTTGEYFDLICHIDSLVGVIYSAIIDLGQSNDRMLAVISDHGHSEVTYNLDLRENFKKDLNLEIERGESAEVLTDELTSPLEKFSTSDGYFVINGNLSAYLYLKNPTGTSDAEAWKKRLSLESLTNFPMGEKVISLPKYLVNIKGIELVSYRANESTVFVQNKKGIGKIVMNENGAYQYLVSGQDPLDFTLFESTAILMDSSFYSSAEWLKASVDSNYPDGLHRLYSLMSQPDAGDFVICSLENYDLASDYEVFVGNYQGGHGGLRAEMISVPYILSNPAIKKQEIPFARAEDIGATVLEFLDVSPKYSLDGRSLLDSRVRK